MLPLYEALLQAPGGCHQPSQQPYQVGDTMPVSLKEILRPWDLTSTTSNSGSLVPKPGGLTTALPASCRKSW